MQLAEVIGTLVATRKDPGLEGQKFLVIQPLTDQRKPSGRAIIAIDSVQAGVGDLVHWVTAREASLVLENSFVPVDAAITGIVDDINSLEGKIKDRADIFG
jgi:ethanolamine utilization protein EutN